MSNLTAAEKLALDAADGVIDGKVGSVDVEAMTHDKSKSTTEGEWELKDGKYYRRDYYSANTHQKEEDPRDQMIADLRRQISEQELIITELRSLLATRDRLIAELRSELAECRSQCSTYTTRINDLLAQITRLEQRITVLSSKKEEIIVREQPVMQPIQVQQDNSYYVVRSERGAALLNQYGKSNFVVDPFRPPTFGPTQPLTPSFQVQQQQVVVQQVQQPVETVVKEERYVQSSTPVPAPESRSIVKEREYVRVSDAAELARLDALDGSVDGKYNGMDIKIAGEVGNEGWHTTSVSTSAGAGAAGASGAAAGWSSSSGAMAAGGASSSGWKSTSTGGASWSTGGSVVTKESQWVNASSAEQMARLDALDGKIDGKYNGVEIRNNASPAPRGASAGMLTKN